MTLERPDDDGSVRHHRDVFFIFVKDNLLSMVKLALFIRDLVMEVGVFLFNVVE